MCVCVCVCVWLHWVFIAVYGVSLAVVQGLLVAVYGLSCATACGIFVRHSPGKPEKERRPQQK